MRFFKKYSSLKKFEFISKLTKSFGFVYYKGGMGLLKYEVKKNRVALRNIGLL